MLPVGDGPPPVEEARCASRNAPVQTEATRRARPARIRTQSTGGIGAGGRDAGTAGDHQRVHRRVGGRQRAAITAGPPTR